MPSPSKHAALAAAGFALARCCETCLHWNPGTLVGVWGTCSLVTYDHEKHTGAKQAGTPGCGTCPKHAFDLRGVSISAGDDYAARYLPEDPRA